MNICLCFKSGLKLLHKPRLGGPPCKHTVYGLRLGGTPLLLKTEGLPYSFLHLPEIKKEKKLPVVLSKVEVWAMLKHCPLLKHCILIGLLYGCGLRCLEVRSIRLADLGFDRKNLKVVQGNRYTESRKEG